MAKIIITGNKMDIVSTVKLEDIKTLERFRPGTLELYDTRKNQIFFKVGVTESGTGSINEFGVSFGGATEDGFAMVTMLIPFGIENNIEYVTETYGVGLLRLKTVETQAANEIVEVNEEIAAIQSCIVIE